MALEPSNESRECRRSNDSAWVANVAVLGAGVPVVAAVLAVYVVAGRGVAMATAALLTSESLLLKGAAVVVAITGLAAFIISLYTMIWYLALPGRCVDRLRNARREHGPVAVIVGTTSAIAAAGILAALFILWTGWQSSWRWPVFAVVTLSFWSNAVSSMITEGKTGPAW